MGMTIDIIGGGIGGLTTAIALEKKGFKVRLFEQAKEIKPVGAGIILASNAMQVYQQFGLRESIEKLGHPISSLTITKPSLDPLSAVDLGYFEKKFNVKSVAIHRGKLQQLLLKTLKTTEVYLNSKLEHIVSKTNGNELIFSDGTTIKSDICIGADGLNSKVRSCVFPEVTIREANQLCWRGVTSINVLEQYDNMLNEAWGKGERFGFTKIDDEHVYWFALKTGAKINQFNTSQSIAAHFTSFHPVVRDIILSTSDEFIHQAQISDLKPIFNWHTRAIALLGDAAHAMTPNMGQGACQAIEDAYVISECLSMYSPKKAFKSYQKQRLSKAHYVVNTSWKIGQLAHLSNPILRSIRNFAFKVTPAFINRKQSERIFQLQEVVKG